MQSSNDESLRNIKTATAVLTTCIVDALSQADPHFKDRFLANLAEAYTKIRNDSDDLNALETLNWTRTMITGFDLINGQGEPFFQR